MSSEPSKVEEPVAPAAAPAPLTPEGNAATALYVKAIEYLAAKDEGMAVASFLDASDLGHPEATIKSALLYYTGIGITRNLQTASEYAQKYLALAPHGRHANTAREIIGASLGAANGKRILYTVTAASTDATAAEAKTGTGTGAATPDGRRKAVVIGVGIAVGIILLVAAAVFWRVHKAGLQTEEKSGVAAAMPNDRRDTNKTDTADDEPAQTPEEPAQPTQLRDLHDQALAAARDGDFDRAIRLADAMLAIAPDSKSVVNFRKRLVRRQKKASE